MKIEERKDRIYKISFYYEELIDKRYITYYTKDEIFKLIGEYNFIDTYKDLCGLKVVYIVEITLRNILFRKFDSDINRKREILFRRFF